MDEERKINPGHPSARRLLRTLGPILLGIGVLLTMIGVGSFFLAFGSFGFPRFFWCAFLGMPLMFVGTTMCMFGYMGAIARFQAGEVAPVGKDVFNYMADGTQEGVQTLASAVGSGLAAGLGSQKKGGACPACGHPNDADAKFCDECGKSLQMVCAACNEPNDADAKFCDNCGKRLSG